MQGAGLGDQEHTTAGETEKEARPTGADQQLWHRKKKKSYLFPNSQGPHDPENRYAADIRFSQS